MLRIERGSLPGKFTLVGLGGESLVVPQMVEVIQCGTGRQKKMFSSLHIYVPAIFCKCCLSHLST